MVVLPNVCLLYLYLFLLNYSIYLKMMLTLFFHIGKSSRTDPRGNGEEMHCGSKMTLSVKREVVGEIGKH